MAGSMKDIKLRIKSVESTMQITKAMELVASSKLRRAKQRVEQSRPYFEVLERSLTEIAGANLDFRSRYLAKREAKRALYVVIAGDRGLAGGYNSNMFKAVAAATEESGMEYSVLPIGKKAVEYYERRGIPMVTKAFGEVADISVADCFEMARIICEGYVAGQYDEIWLGYTEFVSMLTQTPQLQKILPLQLPEGVKPEANRNLIIYEPDSEEVFDAIVPEYIAGMIYGGMCESVASELGARRTAMDSATKNAKEMIGSLNLYYNRARQAAITQEITEIVAGAEH